MDRPSAPPRAGLTERLSRLRDRHRGACASTPPRPAHGDENAPESIRNSEKQPAARASSFGDAVPRARTPGGSAETGARLAALKARRSQSRPASGRRAVASPTARARVLVPSEDHAHASTSNLGDDVAAAASAAERRLAAVAISNEWREFDGPGTHPERPVSESVASRSTATSNGFALRSANAGAAASATAFAASSATPRGVFASSASRPRSGRPMIPAETTPVVVVTARGPPGAPSSASWSSSPDGGAVLTLARPKTTITRSFRVDARVDRSRAASFIARGGRGDGEGDGERDGERDGVVGTFGGFDALAADAATRGVGCALFGFGAAGCSVSAAVRGGGRAAEDDVADLDVLGSNLGACGNAADALFAAAERVRRDVGDDVRISVQALADVVAAPADCSAIVARRKTHEVLRDVLAEGLDALSGADETAPSSAPVVRGGRGPGAGTVSATYHGADGSVPTPVTIREHPTHGFYAEGLVDVVAEDAKDARRLLAAAAVAFRARAEEASRSPGGGRAHFLAQFNVRRRSRAGARDGEGAGARFLPEEETFARVQIVDVAPVAREERGAAEDAARKALTRVVDSIAEQRSHVPYRDSKLTRLTAHALGGRARLVIVFGVSEESSKFDETDATLRFAAKVADGVKNRPAATTTRFASAVAKADEAAEKHAAALGVRTGPGLTSAGIQLEMDSSDDALALRDALAEGERLRRDADAFEETKIKSDRARFVAGV